MNKQGTGKIDWCDKSWNPATGCLHGCPYCYARRLAENPFFSKGFPNKFKPSFYPDRLAEPYKEKNPLKIFTVSMGDLFGEWVPDWQIEKVIQVVRDNPRHTFQFLTQNPARYNYFDFPKNCWLGQTSNGDDPYGNSKGNTSFLSLEPLLRQFNFAFIKEFDWVIIGAKTKNSKVVEADKPKLEWIEEIVWRAEIVKTAIWMKDSLKDIWREDLIKQFPE